PGRRGALGQSIDGLGVRGEQGDAVAALAGAEGDGGPGAAGEDVGDAADAVDRGERVAGRDEEVHAPIPPGKDPTEDEGPLPFYVPRRRSSLASSAEDEARLLRLRGGSCRRKIAKAPAPRASLMSFDGQIR